MVEETMTMTRIGGTLLVGALLLGAVDEAGAATISAATCNASDVQGALNRATAGDTVTIPAGICTWTSGINWNPPANVTVLGAGNLSVVGGGDATVIIDNYASGNPLLSIYSNASGTFRLAGITFRGGNAGSYDKYAGLINMGGSSHAFRLDHLHFDLRSYSPGNTTNTAIHFTGWVYGVADHLLLELSGIGNGLRFSAESYGGQTAGDGAWSAPTALGTDAFVFIEDSTLNSITKYGTANDCNGGGRFVWRFNIMNAAQMQTHPTGGAGRGRGCRAWEIYGNTFSGSNTEPGFNVFFMSSGTGVIWGNTALSGYTNFVTMHSMRKNNGTYPESPTPAGWGYCGTEFNGTGSAWDGNTSTTTGYPCFDQPGQGVGDLLSGDFPNVTNVTRGCGNSVPCWPRQALEPVYDWRNSFSPAPGWGGTYWAVYHGTVLQPNRDFYLYTPTFTGTTGTGSGLLGSRPATCTPGVAYWATDQGSWNTTGTSGVLYKCTAPNTWTLYYTPYTYPHPLTRNALQTTPPAAPTGLSIIR
jgi:hypothetical protein